MCWAENIFPIQKNEGVIRTIALAFDFDNIFLENKTNIDEDKKENFRMEVVKKAGFSQQFNMPCWSLPTTDISHLRSWECEIVY